MKNLVIDALILISLVFSSCAGNESTIGQWSLYQNPSDKSITISKNEQVLFSQMYSTYHSGNRIITSKDYKNCRLNSQLFEDKTGKGTLVQLVYTQNGLTGLTQRFYFYDGKDFFLTDVLLEDVKDFSCNYIAPVCLDTLPALLEKGDNRALFVPFDNDKWIRYQSYALPINHLISYEVTSVFNNDKRTGLVVGSVEHDNWKTGIIMNGNKVSPNLTGLTCFNGIASETTRDAVPHGSLKGKSIKSSKIFVGFFSDWRTGMETYADVNAAIAQPRSWDKAVPYGWNSWGVLQFNLTYKKAIEVSDFFHANLQNNGFVNSDNLVYIGLDSGWNSFTEEELKAFVKKCKENGQIAGVYWTPFTDWGKNPERKVDDAPEYQYKDVYLYANGKPQDLDGAYAIDPTHPAIEERMKKTADLFHRCGFEYVKMDFMTHGALEADKWFNPTITTGIQAYNYGLQLMDKYFGDMYINLSISPIFPAQYAQSRRIACDSWNKIKDTEYTLNALSYGWWIDRIYQFNDADHIVLHDATEGENRARVSSGVITGLFITGEDFSKGGSDEGKEKAKKFLTNKNINKLATGHSFKPLEGNGERSENQFTYTDSTGTIYYVVFNYSDNDMTTFIPIERLGIKSNNVKSTELWSNQTIDIKAPLTVTGKDVKFIKIEFNR